LRIRVDVFSIHVNLCYSEDSEENMHDARANLTNLFNSFAGNFKTYPSEKTDVLLAYNVPTRPKNVNYGVSTCVILNGTKEPYRALP